jgi:hypothetical protein
MWQWLNPTNKANGRCFEIVWDWKRRGSEVGDEDNAEFLLSRTQRLSILNFQHFSQWKQLQVYFKMCYIFVWFISTMPLSVSTLMNGLFWFSEQLLFLAFAQRHICSLYIIGQGVGDEIAGYSGDNLKLMVNWIWRRRESPRWSKDHFTLIWNDHRGIEDVIQGGERDYSEPDWLTTRDMWMRRWGNVYSQS